MLNIVCSQTFAHLRRIKCWLIACIRIHSCAVHQHHVLKAVLTASPNGRLFKGSWYRIIEVSPMDSPTFVIDVISSSTGGGRREGRGGGLGGRQMGGGFRDCHTAA